ncbi:MAG: hypothetical protein NTU53_17245 [Planctomycetota bacterium]|nr:hypothetical protein [Planctomycetota bacterium]
MGTFWLKVKAWTKVTLLVLVLVLVVIFVILNLSAVVEPKLSLIFASYDRPNLLVVLTLTSLISIVGWTLIGTVVKTLRQLREARRRSMETRLTKDVADMKAKAAMLQTRGEKPNTGQEQTPEA